MGMSPGKYRHLSRVATADGHFVVLAIDHRANLREKLDAAAPEPLSDAAFAAFKVAVVGALAPLASGVLIDPAFGMGRGIADGTLAGHLGLLAPLEITDYGAHPSQRDLTYIPHWSVGKMKRVGCDGVKLLLPFHPQATNASEKITAVQAIVTECARLDIPFFLEPIPYSLDPPTPLDNAERRAAVVESARLFSDMGVDVLKLPFPVDAGQTSDEDEWRAACAELDAACSVPWALLSAGVDYATFARQAEIACQAGASGVIVGRAVWAEAVTLNGAARSSFLQQAARKRMRHLADICAHHAHPWQARVMPPDTAFDWYEDYADLP